MRVLILLAHGSRRKESAQEVTDMAHILENSAREQGQFEIIRPAFMQFCEPDFYQVVDKIIQEEIDFNSDKQTNKIVKGGTKSLEIVILPYFISAGSHVSEDIPDLLKKAEEKYPDISFSVTPHLGKFEGLAALILEETQG
ncbi:MAG: CbiX/SirB N-terminal domain-containing protein [Desulfamplus sp.]|nr:CbiX/SirB N-terminal domain-containing protein [Desulfamplus sp.]